MKKALIFVCTLLLMLSAIPTVAESPFPDIVPKDASPVSPGSIAIDVNGENVVLEYDTSPEYSSVQDGVVEASFYAYVGNDLLVELYLSFPLDTPSNALIDPEYAFTNGLDCSIILGMSTTESEHFYFAGQVAGAGYPAGADFDLQFDQIIDEEGTRSFNGTLSATLVEMDLDSGVIGDQYVITAAPFNLSVSHNSITRPSAKPTLPPDTRRA